MTFNDGYQDQNNTNSAIIILHLYFVLSLTYYIILSPYVMNVSVLNNWSGSFYFTSQQRRKSVSSRSTAEIRWPLFTRRGEKIFFIKVLVGKGKFWFLYEQSANITLQFAA